MAHITPLHLSELTPINFQWSFKPTFITLKVLGLHFEPLTRHQLLSWKILPIIYCLLCFSLYSACVIFSLIWMTMNQKSFLPDASNASWLSYKFENLDFVLFGAAMQAMSLLRQQRIPLARLMDNIETEFAFGREVYRRFRRLGIISRNHQPGSNSDRFCHLHFSGMYSAVEWHSGTSHCYRRFPSNQRPSCRQPRSNRPSRSEEMEAAVPFTLRLRRRMERVAELPSASRNLPHTIQLCYPIV